jgi:hypothetical protein
MRDSNEGQVAELERLRKELDKAEKGRGEDKKVTQQLGEILQQKAMEIITKQTEVDNLSRDLQIAKKRV